MYVNADYASKATDRRSVSGALVLVAGCIVALISRTQKCVTLSTTEAEYVSMGVCEGKIVREKCTQILGAECEKWQD